MNLEEWI